MQHPKYNPVRASRHIIFGPSNPNMLGVIRSLGRENVYPIVVTYFNDRIRAAFVASKHIKELHICKSREECLDLIIARFCAADEKAFLHVTVDTCMRLCSEHYEQLKDFFHVFHTAPPARLEHFMDKAKLCELANECGLTAPRCEIVSRGEFPKTLSYPIYVKCLNPFGAWKEDMEICRTPEDLREAYNHLASDQWLMQDYIDKQTEVSLQGISVNGGEQVYMPYKKAYARLRAKDFGTFMYYEANDLPAQLLDSVKRAIQTIRFSGCFEVEFLQDKHGKLFFLEINWRYSASNQGMTCGGVNLPMEWALAEITGGVDEAGLSPRPDRYFVMNDILEFSMLLHGKLSVRDWMRDFWKADCHYLWDRKDIKPTLMYAYLSIKQLVCKLCKRGGKA